MARKKRKKKHVIEVNRKTRLIFITVVLVAFVVAFSFYTNARKREYEALVQKNAAVLSQIDSEKSRADKLESEAEFVNTDEYIIKTAREKLGLIFPDEIAIKQE